MSDIRIEHNFNVKSKQIKKYGKKLSSSSEGRGILLKAMHRSLDEVGFISTGDYMNLNATMTSPVMKKLSRRSSRLSRSILGSEHGSDGNESIRKVKINSGNIEGIIGSKVPYAEIHEKGGTSHPKITTRSRKFFWAKYFETGDEKWKGMALTNKSFFNIKIPARPYLKPAAKDAMPEIHNIFKEEIQESWNKEHV